jgi:hypothetical protein
VFQTGPVGEERRMVVVLDLKGSNALLSCPVQVAFKFFWQWVGSLMAFPKPLPGRTQRPNDDT